MKLFTKSRTISLIVGLVLLALMLPGVVSAYTTSLNAQVITTTIPSSMNAGQSYPVSVTMKNTGTTTWNEAGMKRLGGVDDQAGVAAQFGPYRIAMPAGTNVRPGAQYTFTFTMTAPSKPGFYTPKYKMVWDGHDWFGARVTKTIQVVSPAAVVPVAAFTSTDQSGTAPLTVQFTDQSVSAGTSTCAWDINNDGVVDYTTKNPVHTYATAGTYTVKLTVTNAAGSDSEIKTGYISVSAAIPTPTPTPTLTPTPTPTPIIPPATLPAAQFTANSTQGKSPLAVQFTDQSVSDDTSTCAWDINNDGVVDYTTKNPVHTYATAGTYTVKLTVTNAAGSDSEIKTGYITATTSPVIVGSGEFGAASNPTGNPLGGGTGYSRIITQTDSRVKYVVSTKDQLITALRSAKSGEVVFIKGSAVIDMTGTPNTIIPAGVILASDRGNGASPGALVKYKSNKNGRYMTSLFVVGGDNVRVTGVRLEGEMLSQDGTGNGEANYLIAVKVQNKAGLEVDNCEIRGWAWSGVTTMGSTGTYIHHNYIHHNQARGEGYGTDMYGGNMLVEANIFDYNRHDIAAGGYPGESYEAQYNLVRGNGHPIGSHHFDVHACNPNDYSDGSETSPAFIAGDLYKIHHNTFEAGQQAAIGIRSRPVTGAYIYNNIFTSASTDTVGGVPVWQRAVTWGNMFVTNNYWKGTLYNGDTIVWYLHPA